jgi:hypothetical protein
VRFTAFTPATNPSSRFRDDSHAVRIEGLELAGRVARAQVQVEPPRLRVASVLLVDEDDNALFTSGEAVDVLIRLVNRGGLRTGALRAALSSEDSLVQLLKSEVRFDPLGPGSFSEPSQGRTGFPRLRITPGIRGNRRISLKLEVFDDSLLAAVRQVEFEVLAPVPWVGRVEDEAGQGLADVNLALSALDGSGRFYSDYTDREGRFRFELPPGFYTVALTSVPHRSAPPQNYRIEVSDSTYSILALHSAATAVAQEAAATPQTFALYPAYPNPFNSSTTISFSLPQAGEAELSIYNLLGQRVVVLAQGMQEAGAHTLVWKGRDDQGRELGSGVYVCRLRAGSQVETRKLLLLR